MKDTIKNETGNLSTRRLSGSFRNAFTGMATMIRSENNARIHFIILVLVIIAGIVLKVSPADWIALSLAAGLVLATECLNTAIEYLCDSIIPEYDSRVKNAKDLAAAGVLVASVVSAVTGLIVFIPALLRIFKI